MLDRRSRGERCLDREGTKDCRLDIGRLAFSAACARDDDLEQELRIVAPVARQWMEQRRDGGRQSRRRGQESRGRAAAGGANPFRWNDY